MSSEHPDPVDVHVGKRLKLRRTLVGMSQEKLGELLGVTFQQIQKYERGTNRMGSSRLFAIGRILNTPVSWFFEDMEDEAVDEPTRYALAEHRGGFRHQDDPQNRPAVLRMTPSETREALELVRAYNRIDDPAMRRRLFELTKALADLS
jgi:transcriptional regulator with XRE-family HTH domain